MPRGKQWILVIGGFALVAAAIGIGVSAGFDDNSSGTVDRLSFRTPSRVVDSRCTNDDVIDISDALLEPAKRAEDAAQLILTASRSALTDIAADLQAIRRDLTAANIPSCGASVRALMVQALDAEIDGVLLLQGGANDAAADKLDEATRINLLLPDAIRALVP